MAANNMYRVGDYVYVDQGPAVPFGVRRIDELQKSATGNVEMEVMIYLRRLDLSKDVLPMADENLKEFWDEMSKKYPAQVHERELFLSKTTETISATQIRGKCSVGLLHKAESLFSYIKQEDTFFYTLVYDRTNESLFEDRGEIKIGSSYQADVPTEMIRPEDDTRRFEDLEDLVWSPDHNLGDKVIDQFLVIARSVGTFARAVDEASTLKQPSLHMSAAAASRDITLFHAMELLHNCKYDFSRASLKLVENGSPKLSCDQMEDWTTAEAGLFEEAMEKYGKGFNEIWTDFLPWKTVKNIVEYYYMWKTTDRYVQQKRVKAVESEHKLKQVYVPDYAKLGDGAVPAAAAVGAVCLCCRTTSSPAWYEMPGAELAGLPQCKICQVCWLAYRKYSAMTPGGMNKDFGMLTKFPGIPKGGKKATTLFLMPTLLAKVARKLPKSKVIWMKRVGKKPFRLLDQEAIRAACCKLVADKPPAKLKQLLAKKKPKTYISLAKVTINCGYNDPTHPAWLIPMAKDKLPQPAKEAFPKHVPQPPTPVKTGVSQNRIKVASAARVNGGKGTKNAPEEIFFKPTKVLVANRNALTNKIIKKLARRPTKAFN